MKPVIAEINSLELGNNGVWIAQTKDSKEEFAYSDGKVHEEYVRGVVSDAQDLSSLSIELESKIIDWPSEYHLNVKRGNLLRGFNYSSANNVLELGCGCGAISRFLGEQKLSVDAVEGSAIRADIARKRCRDLENVNIINCNFNALDLPDGHYDVVFLIGVMEYASRFYSEATSDETAVLGILGQIKKALKSTGVVFIAIENRLGLKYILGASEDHYGKPYVGVYGYPESHNIKTYDLDEWETLIGSSGFRLYDTYFPFPDYKIPTTILSDSFVKKNKYSFSLLSGIRSRDYLREYKTNADEFILWEAIQQAGALNKFSNSFLFVLSNNRESIDSYSPFDFSHISTGGRKQEFRTITRKGRDSALVTKHTLQKITATKDNCILEQIVGNAEFVDGPLLSSIWLRCVRSQQGIDELVELIDQYYHFVKDVHSAGTHIYDLLPFNIVIDGSEQYQIIDNEWKPGIEITAEFVLFRALFYFCYAYPDAAGQLFNESGIDNVEAFILHCFAKIHPGYSLDLLSFAGLEDKLQRLIHADVESGKIENLLHGQLGVNETTPTFHPKLYWGLDASTYNEACVVSESASYGKARQNIDLVIKGPQANIKVLRFDPAETEGYFHIYTLKLVLRAHDTTADKLIFNYEGACDIKDNADMVNIEAGNSALGQVFVATSQDPQLVFNLLSPINLGPGDELVLSSVLDWPQSTDYGTAKNEFVEINRKLKEKLESRRAEMNRLHKLEEELKTIKRSRVWVIAERFRRAFYLGFLGRYPSIQNALLSISRNGVKGAAKLLYIFTRENKRLGIRGMLGLAKRGNGIAKTDYEKYVDEQRLSDEQINKIRERIPVLTRRPKISIVMPVYNVAIDLIEKAVHSVMAQLYENWELCIVDDNSSNEQTLAYLRSLEHPRIKVRYLAENRNISGASNAAAALASGDYLAFLDHDDELSIDALYEVVRCINDRNPEVMYSDEDFIDPDGKFANPHFKPDYSPDLLLSHNYVTHLLVVKRELFKKVDGFRSECDGAQDYDLMLRLTELTSNIVHIPRVLYHWRMIENSTSFDTDAKPGALLGSRLALEQALERRGIKGDVCNANMPHFYRVRQHISEAAKPLVSIIIPFKDKPELLRMSIGSILEKSSYKDFEIIGISNNSGLTDTFEQMAEYEKRDSRVHFYEHNIPFNFSSLINYGACQAKGAHLLIVNNDIEIISWDWIESLLEESQRSEVGVVGAKLYYPDNTVQHAGIIVGIGGYAGHAHKHFPANRAGYFNKLNILQNVSAVTGACMMVKSAIFNEVNGFDEENLGVACNDVDFCLRVQEKGYWNIFTPYAEAYHYESKTRGYEDTKDKQNRFSREKSWFCQRHKTILDSGDPFYNPNLSLDAEDFRLRM